MDALEQFLVSSPTKSGVGAEVLEMLGRKAAGQFLRDGVSLNDAVRESIKDHPEFNNEHIKRVVEFANNVAFQELFQSGEDKNVHFDIADPGAVIRDVKDGGTPAFDGKTMGGGGKDYLAPPKMEKQEFGDAESGMQHLQNMNEMSGRFGQGEQVEKNASFRARADDIAADKIKRLRHILSGERPSDHGMTEKDSCGDSCKVADWRVKDAEQDLIGQFIQNVDPSCYEQLNQTEHANPVDNVFDLHSHLEGTRMKLAEAHEQFNLAAQDAHHNFYQTLKHECLDSDGAGLGNVLNALSKTADDECIHLVVAPLVERMVEEGVPAEQLQRTLVKTGSAPQLVNYDHPLLQSWAGMIKAATELERSEVALEEVDAGLEQTREFLQHLGR